MRSFAIIELIDDLSQVPVKFKLLRRAPGFMLDWYIRKFNPFTAEHTEILGERGFLVRLPLTERDRRERPAHFAELSARTLDSLRDYGVVIVLPPEEGAPPAGDMDACATDPFPSAFPDTIPLADGRYVFPFFLMSAIEKTLKQVGKNIKTAEIVLIDGAPGLTLTVLDNIYPHVNYMTVITAQDYGWKTAEIFDDCGLNVQAVAFNRSSLESADIIINTQADSRRFDYYYKRGAVYFDLSQGGRSASGGRPISGSAAELAAKREDMLIVDSLRLSSGMDLPRFECGLYVLSREYRGLTTVYDNRNVARVAERVQTLGYSVAGLSFRGKVLRQVRVE